VDVKIYFLPSFLLILIGPRRMASLYGQSEIAWVSEKIPVSEFEIISINRNSFASYTK
jgi:hypothetical protein